jgi:hypothetical protein
LKTFSASSLSAARSVPPASHRARGQLRQLLEQVVELLAHVEHREVHIGAPGEAQCDQGDALAGDALHALDAGHSADTALDGLRDEPLDLGRTHVGVLGVHDEPWVGDVGQQIDGNTGERDEPQEDDAQEEHRHRNGATDGAAREGH